jgi:hypothetical protein
MHGTLIITTTKPMAAPSSLLAKLRVNLAYLWRHRRPLNLEDPRRFTELVQARKLYDRCPSQRLLMDKVAAKSLARHVLGNDWAIATSWAGLRLPDRAPFSFPTILKARHGCNQYAMMREDPGARRWHRLQQASGHWLQRPYGLLLDEWAYRDITRGLLAEPLLGNGVDLPIDYKVYVFGGQATHVQVHLGRGQDHRWILHDRDWRQLVPMLDRPSPPRSLRAMLDAAEALAVGKDFLRVDFYEIAGKPLFGEFCLYPGSGLDPFAADWIDFELGDLWRLAKATLSPPQ